MRLHAKIGNSIRNYYLQSYVLVQYTSQQQAFFVLQSKPISLLTSVLLFSISHGNRKCLSDLQLAAIRHTIFHTLIFIISQYLFSNFAREQN